MAFASASAVRGIAAFAGLACACAQPACASPVELAPDGGPAVTYADVQRILEQSCAKQVCHGFMIASAHLEMTRDPRAALVGVPSCEYDRMLRVAPGDPEHSWLMIKIAGPVRYRIYDNFVDFTPDPDWQPSTRECSGQFDDGTPWFGLHMPPTGTTTLAPSDIDVIEAWIRAGARAD
jgi:hypothetical protein